MAFLLKSRSLLLSGLLSILLLAAMQEEARAEPVLTSYYGTEFAGNPTASGEPFDPYALTAAHPYLPFGTELTATLNGRSVTVRVNDRGPYVAGRGLDLSLGAARAIGLTDAGPAVVEVESGETPEAKPQAVPRSEAVEPASTEPASPASTTSSAETVPSDEELESGEHRLTFSTDALIPGRKRVVDSVSEGFGPSSNEPKKVDAPHGTAPIPEASLATRLSEGSGARVASDFYARPIALRRRSGELDEDVA